MPFEQIIQRASAECAGRLDPAAVRITISALSDHPQADAVQAAFSVATAALDKKVQVIRSGSAGYYATEPLVRISVPGQPELVYPHVSPDSAARLCESYLVNGDPCLDQAWCSLGPVTIADLPLASELPLFKHQQRIVLVNCGVIDPERICEYITHARGYGGASQALTRRPEQLIEQLLASGLRGRGGAGYPTAQKWRAVFTAEAADKTVVCTAFDADPKARSARLLLEGDPHRVLEGVLIAAYAVGAKHCIVCIDRNHPAALKRLQRALEQMRGYQLLGQNILGSGFDTEIDIRPIDASLVAGEETALLRTLSGQQTMPRPRPPYPAEKGLNGQPTLVQNIETLATVATIFQHGPQWFASFGTPASTGSKIVTITGSTGDVSLEVPLGTRLRSLLTAAGIDDAQAVQLGGPLGPYLNQLDTALDYESVSSIGSGTLDVIAPRTCMVRHSAVTMASVHSQSCGQCVFCREGSLQIADILQSLVGGQATARDLELIPLLANQMKTGCICNFGRHAANPAISALKLFATDFEAHVHGRNCPAQSKE